VRNPAYRRHFRERLGFIPVLSNPTKNASVWLHAVSVGEVLSAIPLLRALREELPKVHLYLSVSTAAGRKIAEVETGGLVDVVFYLPIDYRSFLRRAFNRIRPGLLIVLETEIWPNLYSEMKQNNAPLVIVNGRISDRTWPRYSSLRWFFCPFVELPDLVLVQSRVDLDRYRELGVKQQKLQMEANLKYDALPRHGTLQLDTYHATPIWIAASTVGPNERGSLEYHTVDEDDLVLASFRELAPNFPALLLILAPRQPSRFDIVAEKLARSGLPFVRRSEVKSSPRSLPALTLPGILLLDTLGELTRCYALADAVFVGGSIAPRGGHNIIEPAAAGCAIAVGPNMQNFAAILDDFLADAAVLQFHSGPDLTPTIRKLLEAREEARELGHRARLVVERKQGVAARIIQKAVPLYYTSVPRQSHNLAARLTLKGLASLWIAGGVWKRHHYERKAQHAGSLRVPVISIGGITVGGSGKTPFTTYLAAQLGRRGYSPAILTRGYRRRSPAENLVLGPGAKLPAAWTGDEAQIFLRREVGAVGIGSNRFETGKILLEQRPETNVLLLDDGFQHALVRRNVDIVLIDGLDPFGRDEVVPLGRLREPLSALTRAHIFIVTRAESDHRFEAIRARLHSLNPNAPVFRTKLVTRNWRDFRSGRSLSDLPARRVAAFCGLGNPSGFWDTLSSLGLEIVFRWAFEDHHSYTPSELQRLAHQAYLHGAELLVTTEKDRINLPPLPLRALRGLDLAWLEIELELESQDSFFVILESKVRSSQ
jgi:3-deoxy-D-manno-octulosonic-acid transferase